MSGKNEQGFSLILAIFLMVVFALLLTALVQIETASNLISGAQATAERALMAAQSGAQAGVYQIAPVGGGKAPNKCPKKFPIPSSNLAGLAGCKVSVTCRSHHPPGPNTYFLVTSTGVCGDTTRTVVVSLMTKPGPGPNVTMKYWLEQLQ